MKGQTALEYMSVYAWAILLLTIIIGVVAFISLSSSGTPGIKTYSPSSCYISVNIYCDQIFVMVNSTSTKEVVIFTNRLSMNVKVPSGGFSFVPSYASNAKSSGNCVPANVSAGQSTICNTTTASYKPLLGEQLEPQFAISYQICQGGACQPETYNTSGSGVVYVSRFVPFAGSSLLNYICPQNYQGRNLQGADFSNRNFACANFNGANLQSSTFQNSIVNNATFAGANMQHSVFKSAIIRNGNFSGANLQSADLSGANLAGANLQGANLQQANLQNAALQGASLQGANFQQANLQNANLNGANTTGANFNGANTSGCTGCP